MAIEVGTEAPDFELKNQHGELVKLSDFRGEKNVVLVFYPFAFTGVCTGELQAIQADIDGLQNVDTQVLAISCDPVASLRAFADEYRLEVPLLSDFWPHGVVARSYGVFNDVIGAAERGTFVIDKTGVVRWSVRTALGEARDVTSYQKALAEL